jgi:hypothetical protein
VNRAHSHGRRSTRAADRRWSPGSLALLTLCLLALLSTACPRGKGQSNPERTPVDDGVPIEVTYEVLGDDAFYDGDMHMDLDRLRAFQQDVEANPDDWFPEQPDAVVWNPGR